MNAIEFIAMRKAFQAHLARDPETDLHEIIFAEAELAATVANDNDDFDRLIAQQQQIDHSRGYRNVLVQIEGRWITQRRPI